MTVDTFICETQAKIYCAMAYDGYDMEKFSNTYLKSRFCERAMDRLYSRYQYADEDESIERFMPEFEDKLTKSGYFLDNAVAYWIGYMYRYLLMKTNVSSKKLSDLVPYLTLYRSYIGLHTLDYDMAADKLIESCNIPILADNSVKEIEKV